MKVGDTFHKIEYGIKGVQEYKCHILAIVDDDKIVYKWYGKYKQWWHYEVRHKGVIDFMIKNHKEWKEGKS